MSGENLELVRRHYEAWNSGDLEAVLAAFSPEIEWHGHPRLPEPGPYSGRDEVARWMAQFREAWGELQAKPIELLDCGDSVLALIHMSGRGRGSGLEVQGGVDAHLIKIEGGKVTSFHIYPGDMVVGSTGLDELEIDALVLRVQEELDIPEIADRLGVEPDKAGTILAGAFDKLRQLPSKGAA
jgi:ketosteroid isomerase-like protein